MAPTWQGQRDNSPVGINPYAFACFFVIVSLASALVGGWITRQAHTQAGMVPDAGTAMASIAEGEESRKPKKPKKPKEPPPDPVPDDEPPKKPKQPTVDGVTERMAGEPELETCVKGSTREQGCPPP